MKKSTALLLGAAAVAVPAFVLAPGVATKRQKAPFMGVNFAHRGLHSRDTVVPENSLEAFRLAAENGYGIELDVQLSKDGYVMVFHDDTLDRVCGVSGRVDEFTYEELMQLRLCGSDQSIPLLREVLDVVNGRIPLMVELKPGKRNKELCEKTYAELSEYRGDVCIESFNPFMVMWFRFHGRDLVRGQLAMRAKGYKNQPEYLGKLLSHTFFNFLARPHFISYEVCRKKPIGARIAELMGAMKVCWTSHEPRNEIGRDAVIFEFYKPRPKFK